MGIAQFVSREDMKLSVAEQTKMAIKMMMRQVASDPVALAEIVAAGPFEWRRSFLKAFRPLPVNDEIANRLYSYFEVKHAQLNPVQTASEFLDAYEPPPSPPTEREIEEGWVIESASSPAAQKLLYADQPSGITSKIDFKR